jgi:hypothetical protein
LSDTNICVLLAVGIVNRNRISRCNRTSHYKSEDWDVRVRLLDQIPRRYTLAHVLAEVNTLIDFVNGGEKEVHFGG